MIPLKFGAGSTVYTFPTRGELEMSDNFRDVSATPRNVIGASGGVHQFGYGMNPTGVGEVRVMFWLKAASPWDMEAKLQDIGKMLTYGLQPLYRTAWNGQRQWCWAFLSNAPEVHTYRNFPEKRNRITLTFTVPDPRWFALASSGGTLWGDGKLWGSGRIWGSGSSTEFVTDIIDTETITNNGNTPSEVTARFTNSSGSQVDVYLARTVGGLDVEWVRWNGTLTSAQTLIINSAKKTVKLNHVSSIDAFSFSSPNWLTIMPGSNTFTVRLSSNTGQVNMHLYYDEAYR